MKQLFPLCAAAIFLAACGRQDQPQQSADSSTAPAAETPAPAATPADMASAGAVAQLAATQGNTATGSLNLTAEGDGVRLSGSIQGLPPDAEFGFHIHEKGDCSAPDASSAGEHFNPTGAQHGNPQGAPGTAHHAGDMINVKSDAQGIAQVDARAMGVSLQTGQSNDVFGKAVVLHRQPDDYATQPSGNSGPRIACGVISTPAP